jgi:hypothetical protein
LKLREFGRILGPRSLASAIRRTIIAIQIVMDHTDDRRHAFDPSDAQELAKAEQRFDELTNVGLIFVLSAKVI